MGHKKGSPLRGFGARYGRKIRHQAADVSKKSSKKYKCPSCGAVKIKRIGTAVWQCKHCGAKFAGRAYSFLTPSEEREQKNVQMQ